MRIIDRHRKAMILAAVFTVAALIIATALHFLLFPERPMLVWFMTITGLTAAVFYWDKRVSRLNDPGRRIPELTLLWLCLIGGSVGGIVVMLGRRHKTIDPQFRFMLGIIVGIQIGIVLYAFWSWATAPSG